MKDRLPLYKRATWLYALALGCIGAGIIWADEHWLDVGWLQRHGPNFGADFIGLAVTLLLIDRIIAWRRHAELHPRRQSAVRRLGEAVRDLEIQMAWVYKAASRPETEPQTVQELIDAFVEALARVDFAAVASTKSALTWDKLLPQRLEQITTNLDRAVTRHEELLPARLSAAIDAVVDDPSLRLLRNEPALSTALALVDQGELLPRGDVLCVVLKDLYREYAEFRGRDYVLVAWEVPREWGTALRENAFQTPNQASRSPRESPRSADSPVAAAQGAAPDVPPQATDAPEQHP
jgi:hypothetical protein